MLAGQSDPLCVPTSLLTKTHTPSTDDPAQEDLVQKYQERVERLSQQNRVIKICTDAGFLTTVDVGQTGMVGFEGTPKLGPYWKLQPVAHKVNMEWKLELNL